MLAKRPVYIVEYNHSNGTLTNSIDLDRTPQNAAIIRIYIVC